MDLNNSQIRYRASKAIRPGIILLSILLFFFITKMPAQDGLSTEAQKTLAVFVVAIILWVTQAIPLMITSLLVVILFPLLGVVDSRTSYALFGNEAIFFILGAFILASGLMRSGLSTRLALFTLRHTGHSPRHLVASFLCLSAFLSFWMSEHAVAAMMFPIVFEVVDALKLSPMKSRFGTALFLATSWGCITGGVATFLGGARAPLALGILNETTGLNIGFVHWLLASLPVVILVTLLAYVVLLRMFPPEIDRIDDALQALKRKELRMGHISRKEIAFGFLMVATIVSWIILGEQVGLANIAIAAVVLGFAFRLLEWKEVEEDVNWGIFLMYGGAICLGFVMAETGAARWLADKSMGYVVHSAWTLMLVVCFIALFLTEMISNTAVVALMMPLAIGLAIDFEVDPRIMTLVLTIPSGLAFQLPMGTPATAIAYSSGFVRPRDTIIGGLILKLFAFMVFAACLFFYWPLIGFGF